MHAALNPIDTDIIGGPVLEVRDFDPERDLAAFEHEAILPLHPRLTVLKVPAEQIAAIHSAEALGFRYAENQLQLIHRMKQRPDPGQYPYRFEPVRDEAGLGQVLDLAATIFAHDRITTDPLLGHDFAGRRYQAYVRKSFGDPEEEVFLMRNLETGNIVSFATIRRQGPSEARLLIGGVANAYKQTGLGVIHDYVGLAAYYDLGIRTIHTSVSAINTPIMNLEIRHLGFKVVQAWVVLHKHYPAFTSKRVS